MKDGGWTTGGRGQVRDEAICAAIIEHKIRGLVMIASLPVWQL